MSTNRAKEARTAQNQRPSSSSSSRKDHCASPTNMSRSNSQPKNSEDLKDGLKSHSFDEQKFNKLIMPPKEDNETADQNETNRSDTSDNSKTLDSGNLAVMKRQSSNTSSKKEGNGSSGIPLFVKGKICAKSSVNSNKVARTSSLSISTAGSVRTLEMQFVNKKKRFDQIKKELLEKQRPVIDLYKNLLQLKKKLEQNGKNVTLDNIKIVDYNLKEADLSGGGESKKSDVPPTIANLHIMLQQIPNSFKDLLNRLNENRSNVLSALERSSKHLPEHALDKSILETLKQESNEIEKRLRELFHAQDKKITDVMNDWQTVLEGKESPYLANKHIQELHAHIQEKELLLTETKEKIKVLESQLANVEKLPERLKAEENIAELAKQIKSLEKELETERRNNSEFKTKTKNQDQMTSTLKQQIKDMEKKNKEAESKIVNLQKKISSLQEQSSKKEFQWTKEKEDLQKSIKNQEMLLQKMTIDRNHYETRMKASEEIQAEKEKKHLEIITKLKNELEEARKIMIDAKTEKDAMKKKYEVMEEQVFKMGVRNKQALDVVSNKIEQKYSKETLNTEREAELYTELLATKVTLKDYEDKIKTYEREKLRFIDTIEQLNGSADENQSTLGATLVKKEEEISRLQELTKELEQKVNNRGVENKNLKAEVKNLRTRLEALEEENVKGVSSDLKKMIYEGRAKLNEAMKRSLENEQKIIQYEHDLDKQSKQINEMENLLKVRDGLIGMMKVKKDELQMENESLTKYANEVRELLLEAKEDLRCRNEMVQELSANLDTKGKICHKLEKKIKELESTLTVTNEKRFKLQDTLGSVEKELQSTKAHINQMADMHTRYDSGMNTLNNEIVQYNTHSQRFALVYQDKNMQYPDNSIYPFKQMITPNYQDMKINSNFNVIPQTNTVKCTLKGLSTACIQTPSDFLKISHIIQTDPIKEFAYIDDVPEHENETLTNDINKNVISVGIMTYRSNDSITKAYAERAEKTSQTENIHIPQFGSCSKNHFTNSPVWCNPNTDMQINSVMMAQDFVAQSLHKIREDIESSLNLVKRNFNLN